MLFPGAPRRRASFLLPAWAALSSPGSASPLRVLPPHWHSPLRPRRWVTLEGAPPPKPPNAAIQAIFKLCASVFTHGFLN